jgi:hypothetical protein
LLQHTSQCSKNQDRIGKFTNAASRDRQWQEDLEAVPVPFILPNDGFREERWLVVTVSRVLIAE